jgi:hypothetical protein
MADIDTKNIRVVTKRTMLICLLPICALCSPDSSDTNEGSRRIEKSEKSFKDFKAPELHPPVHAFEKPTLNVIDFRALGDGICDDTKAFQTAINAAVLGSLSYLFLHPQDSIKLLRLYTLSQHPEVGSVFWT